MKDVWLFFGFFLGISGIIFLIALNTMRGLPRPTLQEVINIFLTVSSASAGLKLCWFAASSQIFSQNDIDRYYVFAGGIAVIWFAVDTVVAVWKNAPAKVKDNTVQNKP